MNVSQPTSAREVRAAAPTHVFAATAMACASCRLLISSVLVAALAGTATGEEAKETDTQAHVTLRLGVPRALPIVGREQVLVARLDGHLEETREGSVSFHWHSDDGHGQIETDQRVELKPRPEETTVRQPWTPRKTGRYTLKARVQLPHGEPLEATQTVTVVRRPLHFHYYHINPLLEYVTGGNVKKKDFDYWMDRGIIVQNWQPGKWGYRDAGIRTVEAFAKGWLEPYRAGWPGIAIDEFPGGSDENLEVNTILCNALLEVRRLEPKLYIAVYTVGMNADYKIRAFREAADLVLVEAYESHAGNGYGMIRRCDSLEEKELGNKALACLGIGRARQHDGGAITTPQELRRQFHFIRYHYPRMPGVAFFGGFPPLYPELNEAIRRFYIGPVLRVEMLDSGEVHIENIGGDNAPAVQAGMRLVDASADAVLRMDVPPLDVGERRLMPTPGTSLLPLTEYTGDCLILGPPLLWDKEPAEYRPRATAEWPSVGPVVTTVTDSFDAEPQLELTYDTSGEERYHGNVSSARYAIPSTEGRACRLEFDLEAARIQLYGTVSLNMADRDGKSRFSLALTRSTHPGAHFAVAITQPDGVLVTEVIAQKIVPKKTYRLRAEYHPEGFVRVAILDHSGEKLWDTGEIPTYGEMTFDHIDVDVQSGKGAAIEWSPEREALLLCGVAGDPRFVLSAYLDNLSVISFTPAPRR